MNEVQKAWRDMRISYQTRYAKMCKKVKKNESNTDNHGALLEMSYVLITVFGLTAKQVQEIERNGGLTDDELDNMVSSDTTLYNRPADVDNFKKNIFFDYKEDGLDNFREEYNKMLMEKISALKNNLQRFELQSITIFDDKNALGHAVIFMNRNNHASKFEIIFKRDKKYHFYYQNHVCLGYDERKEFETWFKLMIPTE